MTDYNTFLELIKLRRSNYTLSPHSTISDSELKRILEVALDECPSPFASFTTRIVLLLNDEHLKLWDIVMDIIKAETGEAQWEASTKNRLQGFKNAYGTVLFLEDPAKTHELEQQFPFLKGCFEPWAEQASAMHQYVVWSALSQARLGVNLQHYNPLIDDRVKTAFGIPSSWNLICQMPFGTPTAEPLPKKVENQKPMNERLFIRGAK